MRIKALLMAFIIGTMMLLPQNIFADSIEEKTYYQLDTGVIFIWKHSNGTWQYGKSPGSSFTSGFTLNIANGKDKDAIKDVKVYPYTPAFSFSTQNFSYNSTDFSKNQNQYNNEYFKNGVASVSVKSNRYDAKTGSLSVSYDAQLMSVQTKIERDMAIANGQDASKINVDFNVKRLLQIDKVEGAKEVYARMGYTPDTVPPEIKKATESLTSFSPNVEGYLYFVPLIIEYKEAKIVAPVIPPKVYIDCKPTTAFIGQNTPVKGGIQNRNPFDVITKYTLTANGKVIASGTVVQAANKTFSVNKNYLVPSGTKPGTMFTFVLNAEQVRKAEGPPPELLYENEDFTRMDGSEGTRSRSYHNPAYDEYMDKHTYISSVGAWYRKGDEWKSGSALCKRAAVPAPEGYVDQGLNPSVIVD